MKRKLFKKDRKSTFEIFGFDFMVTSEGNVLLIEANSNPCIEESNELLSKLVPRMISKIMNI